MHYHTRFCAALLLTAFVSAPIALAHPDHDAPAKSDAAAAIEAPWKDSRRHGDAAPRPRTPGALRFASYNIENLFDDVDDPALSGQYEDKGNTKADEACRAAALAIKLIDADVLALQEVESKEALAWFRDKYLKDLGYEYIVSIDAGDERGIEQAVLSRFPVSGEKVWGQTALGGTHPRNWGRSTNRNAGEPITTHRSPLLVKVEVPGGAAGASEKLGGGEKPGDAGAYSLWLMVVHHKSGAPGGYWREAEAKQFAAWAKELEKADPNANVIICGDFNARAGDRSVQIYLENGYVDAFKAARAPGAKVESTPAPAPTDKAPERAPERGAEGGEGGGRDSGRGRGDGQGPPDPSVISHASDRTIDFILMNPQAAKELVPGSAFILGTGARAMGADWRNTPAPAGWASDHYPVVIDIVPADR